MTFAEVFSSLLKGFGNTCILFTATLVLALPLGLLVSFGSMSKFKPLKYLVRGFVWIIRGTPLMLQVIIIYYGPGLWLGMPFRSRMLAAVIAFVINYACYFSEIYRGGIEGVPRGQYEAGLVLGMTKRQIFFHVTLLQVIKRIIAPMGNEIVTLVKDTSLSRVIVVIEVTFAAERVQSVEGIMWPLFVAGAFYLIFNALLSFLFAWLEKKLNYYRG